MWVQYDKVSGAIRATTRDEVKNFPKDIPVAQVEVKDGVDPQFHRINPTTKKREACPVLAKIKKVNGLKRDLQEIDTRRMRALEDFYLDGNKSHLEKVRQDGDKIRAELRSLTEE